VFAKLARTAPVAIVNLVGREHAEPVDVSGQQSLGKKKVMPRWKALLAGQSLQVPACLGRELTAVG